MVYVSRKETELNLWWDNREDKKAGMRYKLTINGVNCVYTNNRFFDFKNLEEGKEYSFQIQVVDEEEHIVGKTEQITVNTLLSRKRINVSLPPYNAVGDSKTDNTVAIQQAIDENPIMSEIYLPLGIYVCGKLRFNGGCNLRLDVGAQLVSPNAARRTK